MTDFKFECKPAKKEAVPVLIGLWGKSGSGKTYSALLLARGLVGDKGKIVFIDTENSRAKFYSNLAGGWFHVDLQPPFSPEKYSAAFKYCEQQGADVIIVDSMSHVWEGEGGVLDAAENARSSSGKALKGLAKYKAPKSAHKRMSNNLIRGTIPVIFCIRAKDAVKQVGGGDDMQIISLGWQPIAEKNFVFEMTVDLHMTKDGHYDLSTSKTVPSALRDAIKPDGIVNEAMGKAIAAWSGSGIPVDKSVIKEKQQEVEKIIEEEEKIEAEPSIIESEGLSAANKGVTAYKDWLATLSLDQKETVKSHHSKWSKIAKEVIG